MDEPVKAIKAPDDEQTPEGTVEKATGEATNRPEEKARRAEETDGRNEETEAQSLECP